MFVFKKIRVQTFFFDQALESGSVAGSGSVPSRCEVREEVWQAATDRHHGPGLTLQETGGAGVVGKRVLVSSQNFF